MTSPADLLAALARAGIEASDSALTRALYASDASLYRVPPQVVARPRHRDELEPVLDLAAAAGVPVTMRGAGTSIAGNAVGPGLVVDTRRLDRVLAIDGQARTALVEPGVVHARLQAEAAPYGLRYGPDPSTHTRCTIGGMVGNNACGSRALGYGRTSDNLLAADVLWGDRSAGAGDVEARLAAVVAGDLAHVRTGFDRFSRQVSGYALEHLLPERLSVARLLAGSEGTLGVLRTVTVRLVPEEERTLLVLGYPSMADAADAVPALLGPDSSSEARTSPGEDAHVVACEGLDRRIVDLVRSRGTVVPDLPRGEGWLFVEVAGPGRAGLLPGLVAASGALGHRVVPDGPQVAALWRIREDGAGLAALSLGRPAYSGWEDAAVPRAALGAWLREFEALLAEHGLATVPYGHFGDGCLHARIDFDLTGGAQRFRAFVEAAAERLRSYGGSLSGEHGDGRARSELLPLMYDERSITLFRAVKHAADPAGLLNPGVLVDPVPFDADLRAARPVVIGSPSLAAEVHRCTGVGRCVAPVTTGVMCPSYLASGDEKDSTRGRARVLQEAVTGALPGGLADPAVHEALDLCLSCKGCASDCPTGVDMAAYKAEVLDATYRGRRRPRTHYTLGRLPRWARMVAPVAGMVNASLRLGPVASLAKAVAGIDARRSLPVFATVTLRRWWRGLDTPLAGARGYSTDEGDAVGARGYSTKVEVWVWADSFTDHFRTGPGRAAIAFLESSGVRVGVIDKAACCGLTWITTGQLDAARAVIGRAVAALTPYAGRPILGLEPSCLATMRSDAVRLVPDADQVAASMLTLAELVDRLDLPLPDLRGTTILAQPHCHHHAVLDWDADLALLRRAGAEVTVVPGCCGLAGSFGVERGHYETSVAVAETHLLPAVRAALAADPATVVLADGMSCALQLDDLAGVPSMHLAELLAGKLQG